MIGRSRDMEDKVTVAPPDWLDGEYSFFAVYDGHGGADVADKCGERLHMCLERHIAKAKEEAAAGFDCMDDEIEKLQDESNKAPREKRMGSTAVVVLVGKEDVVVANCGDSRAVLYRNQVVLPLSHDHKPEREDEKERIEAAGGKIVCWNGWRVEGVLSTSRSLGDHYLKPYVTSEPEVTVLERSDMDDFLIIGSDGLFDVMSNERACKVVKETLESTTRQARGSGRRQRLC
ncbi:probable protein phosphatase 2c 8 [Phtheirospermum japonicum]|uniref:protein-serine/threonine phosphatase n=1 Tax=Phtheirospermum japonicum TaxID=374723 RepID=A0A830BSF5_9LAMI|nr:probable protein phosphatase 2c 8 [Phtheirospermum japonicum]